MEPRTDTGQFALKSDAARLVRSIRATDWVWNEFGFLAGSQGISRADLLEKWVKSGGMRPAPRTEEIPFDLGPIQLAIAVETLRQALTMKANAGGAIKKQIRVALAELGRDGQ
jgi:hypothetical protein